MPWCTCIFPPRILPCKILAPDLTLVHLYPYHPSPHLMIHQGQIGNLRQDSIVAMRTEWTWRADMAAQTSIFYSYYPRPGQMQSPWWAQTLQGGLWYWLRYPLHDVLVLQIPAQFACYLFLARAVRTAEGRCPKLNASPDHICHWWLTMKEKPSSFYQQIWRGAFLQWQMEREECLSADQGHLTDPATPDCCWHSVVAIWVLQLTYHCMMLRLWLYFLMTICNWNKVHGHTRAQYWGVSKPHTGWFEYRGIAKHGGVSKKRGVFRKSRVSKKRGVSNHRGVSKKREVSKHRGVFSPHKWWMLIRVRDIHSVWVSDFHYHFPSRYWGHLMVIQQIFHQYAHHVPECSVGVA